MVQVNIGPAVFHGWAMEGFVLAPDGFKGWENPPSSRRTDLPRSGGHGSFNTPSFKNGRLVTLTGAVLANDDRQLVAFADLLGVVSDGTHRMVVETETGVRWADVVSEGEPKFDRIGGSHDASFQVQLFAADPRKYGALREFVSTGSNTTAHHAGNTIAWPRFEVTGFSNGYRIIGPGGLAYTVTGSRTGTDVIDFSDGRVTRNGSRLTGAVTSARKWGVPGGENVSWRVEAIGSGSGSARMLLTDTWF